MSEEELDVSKSRTARAVTGWRISMLLAVKRNRPTRSFMADAFGEIPAIHCERAEGGFYAWTVVGSFAIESPASAERLQREHALVTVPDSSFGEQGEGYLRLTCVRFRDDLRNGLDRIRIALAPISGSA